MNNLIKSWCDNSDDEIDTVEHREVKQLEKTKINDKNDDKLNLNEIINFDYTKISELSILKHQIYTLINIKKYLLSCQTNKLLFDKNLHSSKIEWLYKTCDYLAKLRSLSVIKPKKKSPIVSSIQRNSYEFCDQGKNCSYYTTNKCNKKHIVYNYIKNDIAEIINYISENENPSINELLVSFNTIAYITNHMYDELCQ